MGRDLERLGREIEEIRAEIDAVLGAPGYMSVSPDRTQYLAGCLLRGEDPGPITPGEEELFSRMSRYLRIAEELKEEGALR